MRIQCVGKIKSFPIFNNRAARLGLLASLLAIAAAGLTMIRSYAQSPSLQPATASETKEAAIQASHNTSANDPDQQIDQLFQLAADLKAEVNKTNQEQLSIGVIRKAAAIEQLAHKVRTGANTR